MANPIQTVQQVYAEFGKGNPQGVLDLLADNIVWTDPGYPAIPYAGKRQGKNEVLNFFIEMSQAVTFTHFEPQEFFSDDGMVTVKGYFTGFANKNKKPFEAEWVMLWRVDNGKINYYQAFVDTHNVAAAINN